jgi:hypothetical protein
MISTLNTLPPAKPMSQSDAQMIERWLAEHTDCECHDHPAVSAR